MAPLAHLLGQSLQLYTALSLALDDLYDSQQNGLSIPEAFAIIKDDIRTANQPKTAPKNRCHELEQTLRGLAAQLSLSEADTSITTPNQLTLCFEKSFGSLEEWLTYSRDNLDGIAEELADTLYKILATEIGRALGEFAAYPDTKGSNVEEQLSILDTLLSSCP
jgi:hypothetical protein